MNTCTVRQTIEDYYGDKITAKDIDRFLAGATTYGIQIVVGSKYDAKYPAGVSLKLTNGLDPVAEPEFEFIPANFNEEDKGIIKDMIQESVDNTPEIILAPKVANNLQKVFGPKLHPLAEAPKTPVKRRKWTPEELEYLEANYKTLSHEEIAEALDRTVFAVEGKCWEKGWK